MDRVPVSSSNLRSVGYDEHSAVLEVEFRSGRVYQYAGVGPDVHAALMRVDAEWLVALRQRRG